MFEVIFPPADLFREFVRDSAFPCVGAKSALARGQMEIIIARDIASAWDDLAISPKLAALAESYRQDPKLFQTLVVIFEHSSALDEEAFESALWARVQSLSDKDEWFGYQPDPRVSVDPEDPHFSLSFGGEAFFVVGLHPYASRPARQFAYPTLVFNLHDQFEQLRAAGRYDKLRASIMERDMELAGSTNPMLAKHGTSSEARQYSGRAVSPEWQCPYAGRRGADDFA